MSKFNDLELVVHRPISTNDLDVEKDKSSLMQEVHQIIKNEQIYHSDINIVKEFINEN